jgi:cobalt-zinc-cadmium efflux system protein
MTTRSAGHGHDHGAADRRALAAALALILGFLVVEVVVGLLADSLAVLADAGHMLTDSFALGLALFASWIAGRPSTPARSFGYRRAEILAALTNAVLLVVIAIWIFVEAIRRLDDPPDVLGGWVLLVGVLGLMVNLAAAGLLARSHAGGSLNRRAALRHVLADLLGSAGVIVAGLLIVTTGWLQADAIVSMAIAVLVLASSWSILRESVGILLEGTPRGIDAEEVGRAMASLEGVQEVHDLHIWTISSGFPSLSAHVLVAAGADCHGIRLRLERMLADRFALTHTTLQVEHAQPARVELLGRITQ